MKLLQFKTAFNNILVLNKFTFKESLSTFSNMKFLNQFEATSIDLELFNEYKFSVDQLMELAGLSCAHAISKCYPLNSLKTNRILTCVGPGNNGGDGLVAARHLKIMGYIPDLYYPVRTDKQLYHNLVHQCKSMNLLFLDKCPQLEKLDDYGVIIDGLFGFTFKPPIREHFLNIINGLIKTTTPIASIDIPSGWNVETGPPNENVIMPQLLISLTAPKMCARYFKGQYHFLGGRFVPSRLEEKYNLQLLEYQGTETCVRIS